MFDKYVQLIKQNPDKLLLYIKEMIEVHQPIANEMKKKYSRYKTEKSALPIMARETPKAASKINHKLVNQWVKEIVDTKTGYLFGRPLFIDYDKQNPNWKEVSDRLKRFRKRNYFDRMVRSNGKFSSICAYDAILLYVDTAGEERIMRIDPWEVVFITETDISEPSFAFRYYTDSSNQFTVEFYDDLNRTVYKSDGGTIGRGMTMVSQNSTIFGDCPLFGVANNEDLTTESDPVVDLIDAYDRTMSDFNNEIEGFRLAYLVFFGLEIDDDTVRELQETGAISVPSSLKDESANDIRYLVKQMQEGPLNSHLDRLEQNIIRFAQHVNFTDAATFNGDVTGPAMRFKLFMLENKCINTESEHRASMMYMIRLLSNFWRKKGIDADFMDFDITYSRNLPANITEEVTNAKNSLGMTSLYTTYKLMPSVVPDPDIEMARKDMEDEAKIIEPEYLPTNIEPTEPANNVNAGEDGTGSAGGEGTGMGEGAANVTA